MGKLAQRLAKKLRSIRGDVPQMHFARKLGVSKSTLNRMEIGQQNTTLETLEVLCDRLKCDVGDLFTDDSRPKDR